MPECKVRPDFFVHIKCGEASKCFVDIPLCGLFVFVVVFFVEWKWSVVGDRVP